jgi:hypothetical protein
VLAVVLCILSAILNEDFILIYMMTLWSHAGVKIIFMFVIDDDYDDDVDDEITIIKH